MNPTSQALPAAPAASPSPSLAAVRAGLAAQRQRARRGIWIEALGTAGLLLVAYAIPSVLTDRGLRLEWIFRCLLLVTFGAVVVRLLLRRLLRPLAVPLGDEELALAVERTSPDLKQHLISALQFERTMHAPRGADSAELMGAVITGVLDRSGTLPLGRAIDAPRVRRFTGALLAALAFFAVWATIDAGSLGIWARRNLLLGTVDWPRYTSLSFVEVPEGGVRLPQGDSLTVRVAVAGPRPDQVFLTYRFATGEKGTEPMSRTGEREFTLVLDAVVGDVVLRAEGGDALPVELPVHVVERPRIENLAVTVTFPSYMERDPEQVPPTEGELRLPRGAKLSLTARSHKPIDDAFLLFGNEQKQPLQRAPDGVSFSGEFSPATTGLLVIDVIDKDRLGAGAPPKLLLRIGDDKPPTIDFRPRGIGSLISSHARIPGDLKVKDDFGIRSIDVTMRVTDDTPTDTKPGPDKPGTEAPKPAEVPFENAKASYTNELQRSALRYESPATVDLLQWNPEPDQNAPQNRIRPGMVFAMRFGATDNFGPGEPHHGQGETLTFRVVTREKLFEELRRRQVEQREELVRIVTDEQSGLLEVREMANPNQAGEKAAAVRARLKALSRQQQALGRRVAFVGDLYQRILWEYENNRLQDANKVRQQEALIPQPLAAVAKEAFPATSRLVDEFAGNGDESTRAAAIAGYEGALRRLQAVLKEMEQAESLSALLEDLRVVIKIEDTVIQEVESRKQAEEQSTFGRPKDKTPEQPKKQ